MQNGTATAGELGARHPGRGVAVFQVTAIVGAFAAAVLTAPLSRWDLRTLAVIAGFTAVSDLTSVDTGSTKVKVSGSLLGLMLAMVLLGPAPACAVGVFTIAVGWFRWRESLHYLRSNFLTYAWCPLLGGLWFHAADHVVHLRPANLGFYLLVFGAFIVELSLNFVGVAGYQCYLDRTSLAEKARETMMPLLSAELFSAMLTLAAVRIAVQAGTVGVALIGLMLLVFQYLVGQLLKSKQRGEELHRKATTDELTGLANRERFRARLQERIAESSEDDARFAVMLLDLDRFKEINDTLGHQYGDELLKELGPRVAGALGPDAVVARLGGDEFAILPADQTCDAEALEEIAGRLIACVQEPVAIEDMTIDVGASVGIARFPEDGTDPHTLLRHVEVAMYAAKDDHTDSKLYDHQLDRNSVQRLNVLSEFRRALDAEEIVVFYQPIVGVDGVTIHGAEGLVRWQHPERGLLAPGAFIPTVEQSSLIGSLTRYVLERAIAQCAQWRRAGNDMSVSVNLSVRNLLDRSLPGEIERLLDTYGFAPESLHLEITESMLMSDPERAVATVTGLSRLGVQFSVDDFGTGYSSLANLRRLPINDLKIDRSFVSPMLEDESDLIIVSSTINLGHDLGLRVVAEGVEDAPTLARLAQLDCDLVQGYHISKPLPAETFTAWMETESSGPILRAVAL